jgi:phosphohistidine swiveling domain-containing protein
MRAFPLVSTAFLLCVLALAPVPAVAQQMRCNPCYYGFGKVQIGTSISYSFQLTNVGSNTLRISSKSIQGSSAYSFGKFTLPMNVQPGASIQLPIIFTPSAKGYAYATLQLKSNDPNSPLTLRVHGVGFYPNAAQLTASPTTLNFGNVNVGSSAKLQTTLSASGAAVTISSDSSTNSKFAIVGLTLPVTIQAGQNLPVTVQFTPSASGSTSGSVTFSSNAVNSPTTVQVSGTGVAQQSPQLTANPSSINFGNVTVGSSSSKQTTLSASGAAVTISSDGSTSSEFAIVGLTLPVTIQAGQNLSVTVQFTPNASGNASGSVGFTSNAVNSPTAVQVSGTGVAAQSHSVSLTWQPGDGSAVGYNIYRSTAQAGPFTEINSALDSSTNYTDSTVVSGTTYYYVTTEVNTQGQESGYSNEVKAVIPSP